MLAVGEHAEVGLVLVLPEPDLLDLAMGDDDDAVRGSVALDDHLAAGELALLEAVGEGGEHLVVVELPQQGELSEFLGHDAHVRPVGHEGDLAVAQRVGQAAVQAEHATRHLDPGQNPEQPPRGDLLHLGHGLGRRRQLTGGDSGQARLNLPVLGNAGSLVVHDSEIGHANPLGVSPRAC